ncbi:MAG: cytochrome-c peroxidase [Phycisphaerae bacterium]|nr:cytochrome-c peroxidase [Phycisphaerae bacterium]
MGRPTQRQGRLARPGGRPLTLKEQLGKRIFFDQRLSSPQGQSCASCHDPAKGFANPDADLPVSRGADPDRFGNRNDLTAAYAAYVPRFHYDAKEGVYIGGLFWDGRASDLEEQAKGPFVNPLEMANPDEAAVVALVRTADYAPLFREVFGHDAWADPNRAYGYIAEAIAAYERTPELNPFSSKYDLFLQGKACLTDQEQRGLALFEDPNRATCTACHPSRPDPQGGPPLFTDFTYDNLGVPKNPASPFYRLPVSLNPAGKDFVDLGLGGVLQDPNENGKFRVPTLRNAARTGPYMHNGIFQTLREVVVFYNTRDVGPWPSPEVAENVNRDELGDLGLTEQDVDDIVAFLNTLTDGYGAPGGPR